MNDAYWPTPSCQNDAPVPSGVVTDPLEMRRTVRCVSETNTAPDVAVATPVGAQKRATLIRPSTQS